MNGVASAALGTLARSFAEDGFAVLPGVLGADVLAMLREECASATDPDKPGRFNPQLSRDGRLFAFDCQQRQPRLRTFLFSTLVAEICGALLGENAYFFLDQFVVKAPRVGAPFAWHQDSGYVVGYGGPPEHSPFLSLWIPLDDATTANGTLIVQPGSHRLGLQPHARADGAEEFSTAVRGRAFAVELAAGGLAIFSSLLIHATGENRTDAPRRAYLAQYTPEVMINPGTRQLRRNAVPLLRGGRRATLL